MYFIIIIKVFVLTKWGCLANVFIILKEIHDTVSLIQITLSYDAQHLSKATRDTAAIYLACGVDTSKVSNFLSPYIE